MVGYSGDSILKCVWERQDSLRCVLCASDMTLCEGHDSVRGTWLECVCWVHVEPGVSFDLWLHISTHILTRQQSPVFCQTSLTFLHKRRYLYGPKEPCILSKEPHILQNAHGSCGCTLFVALFIHTLYLPTFLSLYACVRVCLSTTGQRVLHTLRRMARRMEKCPGLVRPVFWGPPKGGGQEWVGERQTRSSSRSQIAVLESNTEDALLIPLHHMREPLHHNLLPPLATLWRLS